MHVVKETMNSQNIDDAIEEVHKLKGYLEARRDNSSFTPNEEYVEIRCDHIMSGVRLHNDKLAEQQSE